MITRFLVDEKENPEFARALKVQVKNGALTHASANIWSHENGAKLKKGRRLIGFTSYALTTAEIPHLQAVLRLLFVEKMILTIETDQDDIIMLSNDEEMFAPDQTDEAQAMLMHIDQFLALDSPSAQAWLDGPNNHVEPQLIQDQNPHGAFLFRSQFQEAGPSVQFCLYMPKAGDTAAVIITEVFKFSAYELERGTDYAYFSAVDEDTGIDLSIEDYECEEGDFWQLNIHIEQCQRSDQTAILNQILTALWDYSPGGPYYLEEPNNGDADRFPVWPMIKTEEGFTKGKLSHLTIPYDENEEDLDFLSKRLILSSLSQRLTWWVRSWLRF